MPDAGELTQIVGAIAAIGALGTAASGLVDATKAFNGGISNVGFKKIKAALKPFDAALKNAESDWTGVIRAGWINGNPKEDQKSAAKSLIRLGLSSKNAAAMAVAGHVDEDGLEGVLKAIEAGGTLSPDQVNILGRFNGAIDAALDGGFEEADQNYRNASKVCAGIFAVILAAWGGWLLAPQGTGLVEYIFSGDFGKAVLVGIIAVPLAPVAKDLTSSLQAAAGAMKAPCYLAGYS